MVTPRRLIALQAIEDNRLFAAGSVFRVENLDHAFNKKRPAYYDYMLVAHPDEKDTIMAVNIRLTLSKPVTSFLISKLIQPTGLLLKQ